MLNPNKRQLNCPHPSPGYIWQLHYQQHQDSRSRASITPIFSFSRVGGTGTKAESHVPFPAKSRLGTATRPRIATNICSDLRRDSLGGASHTLTSRLVIQTEDF